VPLFMIRSPVTQVTHDLRQKQGTSPIKTPRRCV
jgi:hypothetical protein